MIDATVLVALVTVSGVVLTAVLGGRGKKDEFSATNLKILLDGMQNELTELRASGQEMRRDLQAEVEISHRLRRILYMAYDWLVEWHTWSLTDRKSDPPTPDLSTIESVLRVNDPPPPDE